MATAFRASDGAAFIETGWEKTPPRPSFLNPATGQVEHPTSAHGQPLRLWTSDAELQSVGLPAYSGSLHRYWSHASRAGEPSAFHAATARAPRPGSVRSRQDAQGASGEPLNPEGGLMMVRRHAPLSLDDYLDLLDGKSWPGVAPGAGLESCSPAPAGVKAIDSVLHSSGLLFLEGRGQPGRFIESFHLRLRLLRDLVSLVRDSVSRLQTPFLNLTSDSFCIELERARHLPLLWSSRPVLAHPGQAIAVPIPAGEQRHFVPLEQAVSSIFRPDSFGLPVHGQARVRLRKSEADALGRLSVEGTFLPSISLRWASRDLVWLKLPLVSGTVDVFGRLDREEGLANGEARLRCTHLVLGPEASRALQAAEGGSFTAVPFETVPMNSTPCDLHALGVIGVRILIVNPRNTLSVALDEVLSFARQLGVDVQDGEGIAARALRTVAKDPRWVDGLGSHRLSAEDLAPAEAARWLPNLLWWRTVATLARFFPGQGAVSYTADLGDTPNFALEQIFDQPLADLDALILAARGLLFSDWAANREVNAAIARLR